MKVRQDLLDVADVEPSLCASASVDARLVRLPSFQFLIKIRPFC
jgi:hypothetical protein